MCQRMGHRHSVFCVLPPHLLRQVAQNGTEEQRVAALQTLASDSTFRTLRGIRLAAPVAAAASATAVMTAAMAQKQRTISDAHNTENLPGDVARAEGAPATGDPAVDEAYDGLGDTYDFYWSMLSRNSIDDQGMPMDATVHYDQNLNNAFWNGQRMVFGDGDGDLFNRFTIAVDIMGHELTHGVTEYAGPLVYAGQSGALNESVSDVFGSLVKQRLLNQTADQADWLIGAGLFAEDVHGEALRSMREPGTAYDDPVLGKDPQPAHMDDYIRTFEDNGGVHINSGIPNRAFYLAAAALGGHAWEKAGRIWYDTLRDQSLSGRSKRHASSTCPHRWANRHMELRTTAGTRLRSKKVGAVTPCGLPTPSGILLSRDW